MTRKRKGDTPIHFTALDPDAPVELPPDLAIDPEKYIAFERETRLRWQPKYALYRVLVEAAGVPKICRREGCRRAGRCARPDVACMDEHAEVMRERVYPLLRAIKRRGRMRYDPDGAKGGER